MTVLSRKRCPQCAERGEDTRGDNLAVYSDGVYCFSCGYRTGGGIPRAQPKETKMETIHTFALSKRGGLKKACGFYKAGETLSSYSTAFVFNYCDKAGVAVAQKVKERGQDWVIRGDSSKMTLYGQWLFSPNPKLSIVITEGEIDCLSVAEAQGCQWPVVSVPHGAGSAYKHLQENLDYLQGFREVILAFDSDQPGKDAIKKCVKLFEPGKVKIVHWPEGCKDANEVFLKEGGKALDGYIYRATSYKPEKIITVSDIRDEILKKPAMGLSWPWPSMTRLLRGVQPRKLLVFLGAPKQGKTTVGLECAHHMVFEHGMKVGIISFEQAASETYQRLCGIQLNKKIHDPETIWTNDEIAEPLDKLEGKVYCVDDTHIRDFEELRLWVRYMSIGLGCKFLIIDNLSNIAATFKTDERKGIDYAMIEMEALARTLDTTIVLMAHLSKPMKGGRQFDEGKHISMHDGRGSDGIAQHCTDMIGIERNAQSEDLRIRNEVTMRILACRSFGESRGQTFSLTYDPDTGRIREMATRTVDVII